MISFKICDVVGVFRICETNSSMPRSTVACHDGVEGVGVEIGGHSRTVKPTAPRHNQEWCVMMESRVWGDEVGRHFGLRNQQQHTMTNGRRRASMELRVG